MCDKIVEWRNLMIDKNIKKCRLKITITFVSVCAIIILILNEYTRGVYSNILELLYHVDPSQLVDYIKSFGIYAILVSFMLMMLQSILAPIPAFLITCANALIWGWWRGAILSWVSAMAGATLCFYLAKGVGRDGIEKYMPNEILLKVDGYFDRYGKYTILICRLLPFISFDFVSYGAGLTSMSIFSFLLATGLGQLPATIIYSYLASLGM